jgi:rhomboid protease GluP
MTLLICLGMSQVYWNHSFGEYLAASPEMVFEKKQYWRLFTSSFIHGDLAHLLSNSVMLSIMGYFVCSHYGASMYPLLGFIVGIFINLIVIWDYPARASLVGASGVVHYLWGFWLVLYIFIQKHIPLGRRFMKATAVGIFILVPTEFKPQVSYYAHGVGLALGVLCGFIYYLVNYKKISSFEVWEEVVEEDDDEEEYEEGWHYLH